MIRWGWLLASCAWAVLLCFPALWLGDEGHLWGLVAEARFNGLSWAFVAGLLEMATLLAVPYVVLGALCRLATGGARGAAVLGAAPLGWVLACLLAFVVEGIRSPAGWQTPAAVELLLPVAACLVGVVLGAAFLGGAGRFLPALLGRMAVLAVLAGAVVFAAATLVLAAAAPDVPHATISSEQKRALVNELRRHNPLKLAAGQRGGLALAPDQLQALLSWTVLLLDDDARQRSGGRRGPGVGGLGAVAGWDSQAATADRPR